MDQDNVNINLTLSCSPHIHAPDNTRSIMLDVVIAMIPAIIGAGFFFGLRALMVMAVSVAGCVFFEWLYRFLLKKDQTIGDCSAVVTGLLLALVCPATVPYWMILIGDFFAIVVAKQLFGGIGCNFLNPALAGRAFLFSYPVLMTTWVKVGTNLSLFGSNADAVTSATPLSYLHQGTLPKVGLLDCLIGTIGGSMGETSAILLLVGLLYLLVRKVISLRIPLSFVGTVAIIALLFPQGNDRLLWTGYQVLSGGLLLGAIFMATDYATSPVTKLGQMIYGIGCGVITMAIRYLGAYPEGVSYAILIMNVTVYLLDKVGTPRRFGLVKEKKEAAEK